MVGACGVRQNRAVRRSQILASLKNDDFAPRRARYAREPSLAAGAALAMLRSWDVTIRDDAGAPRGAMRRIAERLGEREDTIALLVALCRAAGLGRLLLHDTPPGSLAALTTADLGALLRATYRRGGAWDETRVDAEVSRTGFTERGTTAAPALRMILLDALEELARDRWVPVDVVIRYALDDPRAAGAARIHERARREKPGVHRDTIEQALRATLTESVPAIGLADLGEDGATVRLSTRESTLPPADANASVVRGMLEVPASVSLYTLLGLADFAELDHIRPDAATMVLSLGAGATARARARGFDRAAILSRVEAAGIRAPLPAHIEEIISGLGTLRDLGMVAVGGALVAEDPGLRAEVWADPVIRRLLLDVDAGPLLLVRADADVAKLQARLHRLGVKLGTIEPEPAASEPSVSEIPPAPALPSKLDIRRRRTLLPAADDDGDHKASAG